MPNLHLMIQTTPFHVLILAAGNGARYAGEKPKQYEYINGVPILRHVILKFLSHKDIKSLHAVINPEHKAYYEEAVKNLRLPLPIHGGNTRKESCYNGLIGISEVENDEFILIHDAARPLFSAQDINNVLKALETYKSVSLGTPLSETLRRGDADHILNETIDRTNCWALQTPQGFHYGDLLEAHKQTLNNDDFTDDCGVMEHAGHKSKIVQGGRQNIKITWPEDLNEVENYMRKNTVIRVGQGFDVHAFGQEDVSHIRLGGIDIPHDRNLEAHSDGDVVLHALTDALLGSIGEGDIGLHFPPSDPKWAGHDSSYFLIETQQKLYKKQAFINNIDITLICERPKLVNYRETMRTKIASLLDLNDTQVNIKATTTETLGFTGREEGIACQAAVSVSCMQDDVS